MAASLIEDTNTTFGSSESLERRWSVPPVIIHLYPFLHGADSWVPWQGTEKKGAPSTAVYCASKHKISAHPLFYSFSCNHTHQLHTQWVAECSAPPAEMSLLPKDPCVGGEQSSCCSQVGDLATKVLSASPQLRMLQMNESPNSQHHPFVPHHHIK